MPRSDDTPPARPPLSAAELDDLRCPGCRRPYGHRRDCPYLIDAIREVRLKAHAVNNWVRAITVRAAERTMRGVAECGFTYFAETPLSEEPTTRRRRR